MNLILALLGGFLLASLPALFFLRGQRLAREKLEQQLQSALVDLQRLQTACARLAPGDVADRLGSGMPTQAEHREATALFADLVGFTAMSEKLEPHRLARVLNGYFEAMSQAITGHRGHISTFIGDGILAYFGALEPNPWQCNDAAHAALAMRANLLKYNQQLKAEGLPELKLGVGLHHGVGLAGMIGSAERTEFAFVGRTVNLSARVQSLTRVHNVDILLTEAVREKLDPAFQITAKPAERVKGIEQAVVTYALEFYSPGKP